MIRAYLISRPLLICRLSHLYKPTEVEELMDRPILQKKLWKCMRHFSTIFDYICRLSHLYKPTEVEELMDRRDRIHSRLYTKLICTLCEPTPQPEREIFQTGQLGYWVSTLGYQNYLYFWQKLNIFQEDYCILWIDVMPDPQNVPTLDLKYNSSITKILQYG